MDYAGCIVVEDSNGRRFQIHEYRASGLFSRSRRFVLETGEPVKRIDFDTYKVASTEQILVRVKDRMRA